jgi:hypothetical protein
MESFHEEKTAGLLCIIVSYLHTVSLSFLAHLLHPPKKSPTLRSLAAIDLFPFLYSVPWWLLGLSRRLGFLMNEYTKSILSLLHFGWKSKTIGLGKKNDGRRSFEDD